MEPTPTSDNGRQSRGLARFWPVHGMPAPTQRQSDEDFGGRGSGRQMPAGDGAAPHPQPDARQARPDATAVEAEAPAGQNDPTVGPPAGPGIPAGAPPAGPGIPAGAPPEPAVAPLDGPPRDTTPPPHNGTSPHAEAGASNGAVRGGPPQVSQAAPAAGAGQAPGFDAGQRHAALGSDTQMVALGSRRALGDTPAAPSTHRAWRGEQPSYGGAAGGQPPYEGAPGPDRGEGAAAGHAGDRDAARQGADGKPTDRIPVPANRPPAAVQPAAAPAASLEVTRPVSSQPVPVPRADAQTHGEGSAAELGIGHDLGANHAPRQTYGRRADRTGDGRGDGGPARHANSGPGGRRAAPAQPQRRGGAAASAHGSGVPEHAGGVFEHARAVSEHPGAASTDQPMRPGDVVETRITVWDEEAMRQFHEEWHEVKALFVDDPVAALTRAHDLLTEAVHELTESLLAERDDLDPLRRSTAPDTESMRMAMRGYREFLDRILAL